MNETFYEKYQWVTLAIFFIGGILLVFRPSYDYTLIKNVIGYLFCLLAALGFIFIKREFSIPRIPLYAFIAFAVWIMASAFYAGCGYGAGEALENYLLYFLIFIVASQIEIGKGWLYLWLGSALIAAIWGFIQDIGPSHYGISSFGNPNFLAGHLLMPLMLGVAMWKQKKIGGGERFFLGVFLIAAAAAIVLTKSRAAVYATIFGIALFLFFVYPIKGKNFWKGLVGLVIFSILTAVFSGKINAWFNENIRHFIWGGTWNLISAKPWTGWGLGNFVFFYPYYRIRTYFLQAESTPVTNHPHNIFLEQWSEIGIVGVILFLALIMLIIASVRRISEPEPGKKKNREEKEPCDALVRIGAGCAIAAVLVDNVFSTNLTNASTAMFFWFLLGIMAGSQKMKDSFSAVFSRYLWIAVAVAGYVMAIFYSYYRVGSQIYLKSGIWAKDSRDFSEAARNYSIACRINPHDYVTWYKLAYVYGETGQLKEAEAVYQHLTQNLFPHFAKTDANLGTIYLKSEQPEKALYHYQWADWFNPYDKDVMCSIASIYLVCYNNKPKAKPYLERVLKLDPGNEYANRVLKSFGGNH